MKTRLSRLASRAIQNHNDPGTLLRALRDLTLKREKYIRLSCLLDELLLQQSQRSRTVIRSECEGAVLRKQHQENCKDWCAKKVESFHNQNVSDTSMMTLHFLIKELKTYSAFLRKWLCAVVNNFAMADVVPSMKEVFMSKFKTALQKLPRVVAIWQASGIAWIVSLNADTVIKELDVDGRVSEETKAELEHLMVLLTMQERVASGLFGVLGEFLQKRQIQRK